MKDEQSEPNYPGQVFADAELDYSEAMKQFVVASQTKDKESSPQEMESADIEKMSLKAQKQALQHETEVLRLARRQVRQQRKQEDEAWQSLKAQHRQQQADRKAQLKTGQKRPPWGSKKAYDEQWSHLRQHRRDQLNQRQLEDEQWRQQRYLLRQRASLLPFDTSWIAVLVITDNCSRQCLGLPLFVAGSKVTAEAVVDALSTLLPPRLQFLISDRGIHFTANVFEQLAKDKEFLHVLTARHRPQSNGIAERFVRTLKEWLADKSWLSHLQLDDLLSQFMTHYNNRPHQGLPIPGLSPNEFSKRFWLF